MKTTIGVVGLSHLGVIWSVGYASLGFDVVAYDRDPVPVDLLNAGNVFIPEPGLEEQFQGARERLTFTKNAEDLASCNYIFFARDVPYDEEGRIDLTEIEILWDNIIPHLSSGVEIIFMGQVPVGYTRKLENRIHQARPDLKFNLIYRVETLTISQAVPDFLHPDRIIVGTKQSGDTLSNGMTSVLIDPFKCPAAMCSYESAELAKSAINIYLATSVTFVNTISDLCEKVGANIQEITAAMKLDKRFSPYGYWRPGLGFAGGHLERDLMSLTKLANENDMKVELLDTIITNSKQRYQWLKAAMDQHIFSKKERPTICLWGLAYKKGTDSLHNSHCLKVFRDYIGKANIRV